MSIVKGKLELQLMRGYETQFRQIISKVVSLSYECLPLNAEQYTSKVSAILQQMKSVDPNQKDLTKHDQIILGKIQGQLASSNFKKIIQEIVGEVSDQKFKAYLKQKTQQRNFGVTQKEKNCSVRQVKKLQLLKTYFDINEIGKKRKYNKLYSISIKSLAKYLDLYGKIDESNYQTIQNAFQQYNTYKKQTKKFEQFVQQLTQSKNIVQKPVVVEQTLAVQPLDIKPVQYIEQQNKIVSQIPIQNLQKKIVQQINKTPKKKTEKKKESKPQKTSSQNNSSENNEKEKGQNQKINQKNTQKKPEKQEKQKPKKQNEKVAPIKNNMLLTKFFTINKQPKKQQLKPAQNVPQDKINSQPINDQPKNIDAQESKTDIKLSIWDRLIKNQYEQSQKPSIQFLRQQFRSFRMQDQQYNPEPYCINIIMSISTLQYFNYLMKPLDDINFAKPFSRIKQVLYFQDQSQQYEGQSADDNLQEEPEEQQDELSSGNNTILSDDYLSNEQLSSCGVDQIQLKVQYGKGRKWVMNFVSKTSTMQSEEELQIINNFSMICLQTQDKLPLRLDQQQQTNVFVITPQLWAQIYKITQGYYGTKQKNVSDIFAIIPQKSKNWIDQMLKQRSQKIGNQRFIKKDFIEELKQKIPQIEEVLQKMVSQRNEQLRKMKAEKNQQKDQKLQKDILQCTGSRYIVNLLKQLKQKGYKQLRRNNLIEFINERQGQQWDKIRAQMNSMSASTPSRPKNQTKNNMPVVERIQQQVVQVDDQEFKKIQNEDKKQQEKKQKKEIVLNTITKFLTKQKTDVFKDLPQSQEKMSKKKSKLQQKKEQDKMNKMKKRKARRSQLPNIYQKTKPINRARKTRNSLKTGIPSIEQLKKQKQQEQKLKSQQQGIQAQNQEQLDGQSNQGSEDNENQEDGQQMNNQEQGMNNTQANNQNPMNEQENKNQEYEVKQTPHRQQRSEQQKFQSVQKSIILSEQKESMKDQEQLNKKMNVTSIKQDHQKNQNNPVEVITFSNIQ